MTDHEPIRVLMLFTILNRGGAESMVMNYYREIDRTKVQFDFVVHREEKGDFEDEITALGGKVYRMMSLRPHTFGKYARQIAAFFDEHPEYQIIHGQCSESGYFFYKEAAKRGIPVIIAHAHNSQVKIDAKWFFRTWMKHQMPLLQKSKMTGNRSFVLSSFVVHYTPAIRHGSEVAELFQPDEQDAHICI